MLLQAPGTKIKDRNNSDLEVNIDSPFTVSRLMN